MKRLIKSKYMPFMAAAVIAFVATVVRIILSVTSGEVKTGVYGGSKTLLFVLAILYFVAVGALAVYTYIINYNKKACIVLEQNNGTVFTFSAAGFFCLFTGAFLFYSIASKTEFHDGASTLSEFLLLLFSAGAAFFYFIQSSKLSEKWSVNPAYPLLYILPLGWAAIRLFTLFRTYTSKAVFMTEKLQVLALVSICVYILLEARFMRFDEPIKSASYLVCSVIAIAVIPVSALPTFVLSLIFDTTEKLGEPMLCLAELAICECIALRAMNITSGDENA